MSIAVKAPAVGRQPGIFLMPTEVVGVNDADEPSVNDEVRLNASPFLADGPDPESQIDHQHIYEQVDTPMNGAAILNYRGGSGATVADFDTVSRIAEDRPGAVTLPPLSDPAADHADDQVARRRADIDEKHKKIVGFLNDNGYDAVVLARSDSISWFTSGADIGRDMGGESGAVLIFINRNSRAVLADNVQSARVFEEELAGLGFQLKERPWHEGPERVVAELSSSRKIATDNGLLGMTNELEKLRALRLSLSRIERRRLRDLGWTLAAAVESTCRNFHPGETEADIAGHLAHRLIREGVVPVNLRIAGDDRLDRYRQPTFKAARIERHAVITATGRRHGLCATATRVVTFGKPEKAFRSAHAIACMVDATYIFFSRPGQTVSEVFRRARRIMEKYGKPHEWTLDYTGYITGYSPREALLLPESEMTLDEHVAVAWSPSIGSTRSGDTAIINDRGYEVVTPAQNWPKVEVLVKGYTVERPGILER